MPNFVIVNTKYFFSLIMNTKYINALVAENQMAEEASLNQLDIVSNSSYVVYNKNVGQ